MSERIGLDFLNDDELLAEVKRLWYEKALWEWECEQEECSGPAYDYMGSDMEEHIDAVEKAAQHRGIELPDREEYVSQFR